ncbi:(d)CMP kinase [Spartobacteria bacterium LR76]|nr:(d)CMP kinase [Spartobacteria bacterium LR76]
MHTIIAIDGPAASGKSSVARKLARTIRFSYVNSGSFYRTATWYMLTRGVDVQNAEAVTEAVKAGNFRSGFENGESFFEVDGQRANITDDAVNRSVSSVARVPAVREVVNTHLHALAEQADSIVEGRDIGSAVFPATPYKFYIDASPEVRQQRRSAQGQADEVAARDKQDSSRATAPLTIPEGSTVVDSTHLSIDEVVDAIVSALESRGWSPAP